MIVVDTNIIAHFLLPGILTGLADSAYSREQWCAPILWRSEFRSVLTKYFRAGTLNAGEIGELMVKAERLMWGREFSVRSAAVLSCAQISGCSAYDCEFVALAQEFGIYLVTTDERVVREFPKVAIHLRDFILRS